MWNFGGITHRFGECSFTSSLIPIWCTAWLQDTTSQKVPGRLQATVAITGVMQIHVANSVDEQGEASPESCSGCWGAPFSGVCPPHFVPGKLHFKNKFCDSCRSLILVPLTHTRALSREQAACFVNKRTEGFWNIAPANIGGGAYRVVNNTAGCVGPWLVLFREPAPPDIRTSVIPERWATDDGYLRLSVAKGTLVPVQSLRCGQPQASAKRRKVDTGTALPPLPAQLAVMPADSDADTDGAGALIEAFAASTPEVLSPIEAHLAARASGSVVATVRAYPAQAVAARAAVGVQSPLRGGSQGLQGGLQGELQDILQQDPPVQMLHGQEMKELEARTLDANCGDDAVAACWNEVGDKAGDEAGREEVISDAASYDLLEALDLGSCTSNTTAHSDSVQPEAYKVLKSAYYRVNSTLQRMLGDEQVSGMERELVCRLSSETRQLLLSGEGEPASCKTIQPGLLGSPPLAPSTTTHQKQRLVVPKAQPGLYACEPSSCPAAVLSPPTLASTVALPNHDSHLRGTCAEEARNRPNFEVSYPMGRDSAEVSTILAMRYAALHASVVSRPSLLSHILPHSCTKRIMQQDSADVRTVSSDAVALMEFATELFVGLLTALAWQIATQPARRHTLNVSDISAAVMCSSSFDFLLNIVVAFGAQGVIAGQIHPKQRARVEARRQEKSQALSRLVGALTEQKSRASHAKRRQRGPQGRFLGSNNSNCVESLVGGPPMQPQPAAATTPLPPPPEPPAQPLPPRQPQLQPQQPMLMLSAAPAAATAISPAAVARQLAQPPANMRADYLTTAAEDPPPSPPPLQPTQPTQPTPAAVVVSEATKAHAAPPMVREQRRSVFDTTNVTRIMAHNLPTGVKISRDAKQCMCQIASEMTGFVTMEASAIARDKVANGVRPNIHYSYTYYIYTLTTSHTHTDERVCMYPQWLHSTYRRAASPRLPSAWTSACAPSRTLASTGSCPPSSTGCRRPTPHARPAAAGTVCMTRACSMWAPRRTSARALVAGARGREGMHATGPTARAVAPLGVWYTPYGYGVPVRLQWGDDTHSQTTQTVDRLMTERYCIRSDHRHSLVCVSSRVSHLAWRET